jgi:nucleotide-binding universal stress UspA family protein
MKVLVPTDFSVNSIIALRYAAGFAKNSGAGIFILHINNNPPLDQEIKSSDDPQHLIELLRKEEFLKGIKTSPIIREGNVVDAILDEAKKNDIDLIVMGTRGAGNIARNLFGTNTTKVIGKAECPVLAIPDEALFQPIRKVILSVDLKQKSEKVIEDFIDLVKIQNANLLLIYVHDDKSGEHQRELDRFTEELKNKSDYQRIVGKVIQSDFFPGAIENFALDIEADIIVMITHPRGIFERIFDPSATKLYAFHTTIPLLTLPHHRNPVFFF